MTRKTPLPLLASALLLAPIASHAACFDEVRPWSLRLGGHVVDPVGGTSQTAAGDITIRSKAAVTFNVDYRVCKQLSIDLLAALPVTQGIAIDGSRVASTQHLPPVLSLQYHPLADATIDPFIGLGVNRTLFFREALPGARLQLSNTWGVAAQAGVDWHLNAAWAVGADLRYLQIEPDASVDGTPIGKVKINPLAYGITVSYRF
ncbi:MAG: hypothetical protein C0434_02840 [Xanthomonadaceae bacterium]|nr:hypothetical protein [Xanthomonadaceae bacterium]